MKAASLTELRDLVLALRERGALRVRVSPQAVEADFVTTAVNIETLGRSSPIETTPEPTDEELLMYSAGGG